jgi:alpha-galactosidase
MKRRSFISTSLVGCTGALVNSCSTKFNSSEPNEPVHFSIHDLAQKPPLGWNSFNSYGVYLHHDAAMENLKAMAEKLKPHGYEYFVIDGGWYGEFELIPGTLYPKEKHADNVQMNEYGIYQPSKVYFGKGFKPIVDYAHQLGLKIGIHLMRGICRKAVELNLPVKGTNYRAADIADLNSTCAWNHHNYGIDMSKPGAQEFYDSVLAQVADWEFDFVKVDDLNAYPEEIIAVANAIEKCGRKIVYSLSPGGAVYMPDLPFYKRANMLRTTVDIWDRREDLDKAFAAWKRFEGIARRGFWPDLDMIPFGKLLLMSPEKYSTGDQQVDLAGFGNTRHSNLTLPQMRTFITMRALSASPLFMGGDLPSLDDYSLKLITNTAMLACNQNGECGINVYEKNNVEVWIANQQNSPGYGWLGIFNRNKTTKTVMLTREELGLIEFIVRYKLVPIEAAFKFQDVWNGKNYLFTEDIFKQEIEGDDVVFLRFEKIWG